jgi:hypothetical protein
LKVYWLVVMPVFWTWVRSFSSFQVCVVRVPEAFSTSKLPLLS